MTEHVRTIEGGRVARYLRWYLHLHYTESVLAVALWRRSRMWYLLLTDPLWQYHSVVGGGRLLVAPVISKVARMTEFLKCQELLALPPKRANPKVALPFKK